MLGVMDNTKARTFQHHYIPSGPEFMARNHPKKTLSALGSEVAQILSLILGGLHHADPKELNRVEWADEHSMEYRFFGEMATWDGWTLSALVVLAHDRNVRIAVRYTPTREHVAIRFMRPEFNTAEGMMGHPTIEETIARLRAYYQHWVVARDRPKWRTDEDAKKG